MCRVPVSILIAFASIAALFGQSADTPAYTWSATGPLQLARSGACAAALPDGRIVVAGGQDGAGALRSVEIYQSDGTFAPAQDMLRARAGLACTTLSDGRVLVSGGLGDGASVQAESFDVSTNTWTAVENGTERWNHTATLLPDGRVLLAGGETADGVSGLLEWFDPRTNRVKALPANLSAARTLHASALLPDGSVLVAGGWDGQSLLAVVELVTLDGSVASTAALPAARAGHTATSLNNGCILIAGGLGVDGDLKSASLYCADTGTFQPAGDMAVARYTHLAVLLPNNGNVLVTGGFSQGEATAASELYDPAANVFVPAGSLTRARLGIAAAADPTSGSVLAVGGYTADGPLAACGILHGPSVAFDKARYVDGDTVTVSGLGWAAGEKVMLQLTTAPFAKPGQLVQLPLAQIFQAVASALGRIQQTLLTTVPQGAGSTFNVTATGGTSGLTAGSSARQISRTTTTLTVSPFLALTRQPVVLQALVQPATSLDPFDGTVDFLLSSNPLGSISSTNQFTSVSNTGQITDGTSNTLQVGESTSATTGFSRTFTGGGIFQFVTKDLPAGSNVIVLSGGSAGSVTASYAPITSLYGPSSFGTTVAVQKRDVQVGVSPSFTFAALKVGDSVPLSVSVSGTQLPFADVSPTGNVHLTIAPGNVLSRAVSPISFAAASRAFFSAMLPAGTRSFTAQYDGDSVYQAGIVANAGTVTIGKGTVGFTLIPAKTVYTVGEQITMSALIQHPKVPGATPTGQITRASGPAQFQGAAVGPDPQNTGTINVNLPVTGAPAPGNFTLTMTYGGDANFQSASAGTILTISKAIPQFTLIPPAQIVAGQEAVFVVRTGVPSNLPLAPAVSGKVTLTGVANGGSTNLTAGTGTIRQTFPSAGTFSIGVQYAGDANFLAVTTAPVQVVVQ